MSGTSATQLRKDLHRTGTPKIKVYKWETPDKPGVPYLLDKTTLQIDASYQRVLSEHRVLALAQSWSWLGCGSLLVAERSPGEFFVFDGQHRLEAANRRSDVFELPCLVFKLDDISEEAKAFFRANCVRGNVTVFDKLRALLVANDQVAIDAVALMKQQGYEPSQRGEDHGVRCLGGFLMYFKRERDLFTKTWPLIAELHDGRPIMDKPLAAIMYIAKYGEPSITSPDGRDRLLNVGYDAIMGGINRVAAAFSRGGAKVFAQGVIELLNKGRRLHKFALRNENDDE